MDQVSIDIEKKKQKQQSEYSMKRESVNEGGRLEFGEHNSVVEKNKGSDSAPEFLEKYTDKMLKIKEKTDSLPPEDFFSEEELLKNIADVQNNICGKSDVHINDFRFDRRTIKSFNAYRKTLEKNTLDVADTASFMKMYFDMYSANTIMSDGSAAEKELPEMLGIPLNATMNFITNFKNLNHQAVAEWFDTYEAQLTDDFTKVVEGVKSRFMKDDGASDFATYFAFKSRAGIKLEMLLGLKKELNIAIKLDLKGLSDKVDNLKRIEDIFDNRADMHSFAINSKQVERTNMYYDLRIDNNSETDYEEAKEKYAVTLGSAEGETGILGAFVKIDEVSTLKSASSLFEPIQNAVDVIREMEKSADPDYAALTKEYRSLYNAAKEYIDNRDPWFSAGKKRLAAVKNLRDCIGEHLNSIEHLSGEQSRYETHQAQVGIIKEQYEKIVKNKDTAPEQLIEGYKSYFEPLLAQLDGNIGVMLDTKQGIELIRQMRFEYPEFMKLLKDSAFAEWETLKEVFRTFGEPSKLNMETRYMVWLRCRGFEEKYSQLDTSYVKQFRNQYIDNAYGEEFLNKISTEVDKIDRIEKKSEGSELDIMRFMYQYKSVGGILKSKELKYFSAGREFLGKVDKIEKKYAGIGKEQKGQLIKQETAVLDGMIEAFNKDIKNGVILCDDKKTYEFIGRTIKSSLAEFDFFLTEFKPYARENRELFGYYEHQRERLKQQLDIFFQKQYIDYEMQLDPVIVDNSDFVKVKRQLAAHKFNNTQDVSLRQFTDDEKDTLYMLKDEAVIEKYARYYLKFETEKKILSGDKKFADDKHVREAVERQQNDISDVFEGALKQADDAGVENIRRVFAKISDDYIARLEAELDSVKNALNERLGDDSQDLESTACYFVANSPIAAQIRNYIARTEELNKKFKKKKTAFGNKTLKGRFNDLVRLGSLSQSRYGFINEKDKLEKITDESVRMRYLTKERILYLKQDLINKLLAIKEYPFVKGSKLTLTDFIDRFNEYFHQYSECPQFAQMSGMLNVIAELCNDASLIDAIGNGDMNGVVKVNELINVFKQFKMQSQAFINDKLKEKTIRSDIGKTIKTEKLFDKVFDGFDDFMAEFRKIPQEILDLIMLQDTGMGGLDYVNIRKRLEDIALGAMMPENEQKVLSAIKICSRYEGRDSKTAFAVRNSIEYTLYAKIFRSWLEAVLDDIVNKLADENERGNIEALLTQYYEKSKLYRGAGVDTSKLDEYVRSTYGEIRMKG